MEAFSDFTPEVLEMFRKFTGQYKPTNNAKTAKYFMDTESVYEKMLLWYRCDDFTKEDVYNFLCKSGYTEIHLGNNEAYLCWIFN